MRKALRVLAAAAAIAAAAAVCVVAAAFALYALVAPYVGPAGGGAVVAAAAALFLLLAGLYARGAAPRARREPDASFVERAMDIARKRPLLATGAAVAAGLYALRHPALIAAVMGAVMENKSRKD